MSLPSDLTGRTLSHFRVLERIGAGGMGIVYLAQDESLGRRVALKVLPPDFATDADRRTRFLREARTAAAASHANIATIFEVGESEGVVYLAMEFVRAETLRHLLRDGPLPVERAVGIAISVARALAAAHEAGIVHRDLKPDNVMVGADDEVKLVDFGLAKPLWVAGGGADAAEAVSQLRIREGRVLGTPGYAAPEQALGAEADPRCDLFSFGVLLHEMLAGRLPFEGTTPVALLIAAGRDPPEPLAGARPDAPPALAALVARCMARRPEDRPQSAREIVAGLRALFPGSAVSTPAGAGPARRSATRLVAGAAALAVAAAAGAAIWNARRDPAAAGAGPPPGMTERRLTANPPENMVGTVALSPDGENYAWTDQDGVHVAPVAGTGRRDVAVAEGFRAGGVAYFPDGRLLVGGRERDGTESLWSVTLDTSDARRLRADSRAGFVSPDGTRLAFLRKDALLVAPLEGGPAVRLVSLSTPEYVPSFAWSPDGRSVAAVLVKGSDQRIAVCASDGSASRRLDTDLPPVAHVYGIAWPETARLVASILYRGAAEGDRSELLELTLDGGAQRVASRCLRAFPEVWLNAASIAKGRCAFVLSQSQIDVYVGDVAPGGASVEHLERLSQSDRNDRPCGWLGDGRVLFLSDRNGSNELFAQAQGGRSIDPLVQSLPAPTQAQALGSHELLYCRPSAPGADGSELVRRAVSGGEERRVLVRPGKILELRCSRAVPPTCVICEPADDQWAFSEVRLDDGEVGAPFFRLPAAASVWARWDLSPDGRTVAIVQQSVSNLRLVPVDGGPSREVAVDGAGLIQSVAWTHDGARLLITSMRVGDREYALLDCDLSGRTRVVWSSTNMWVYSPSVSPDGRRIALLTRVFDTDAWLLEPFPAPAAK